MTPAGERNRRIAFERGTPEIGGLGAEPVVAWSEVGKAWAKVLFGTGKERRQAASDGATATATFRVLSNTQTRDLSERDRIQFDGRPWDIASIATIGLNEEIEFTAVATKG